MGTVIHALVIVLVLCAEVGVVVVAEGVPSIPGVVGNKEPVAVKLVAQREETILSVARYTLPVLQ